MLFNRGKMLTSRLLYTTDEDSRAAISIDVSNGGFLMTIMIISIGYGPGTS